RPHVAVNERSRSILGEIWILLSQHTDVLVEIEHCSLPRLRNPRLLWKRFGVCSMYNIERAIYCALVACRELIFTVQVIALVAGDRPDD
ncbi:hypothetical protein PENTCL1PPCAC_5326, partial [Pristionchus entomophagus]